VSASVSSTRPASEARKMMVSKDIRLPYTFCLANEFAARTILLANSARAI
jgi:hypothetical protein